MLLFDTTQIGLQRALAGSAARQQAIATNLANANTPGYQRVDVDFESSLQNAFANNDPNMIDQGAFSEQVDRTAPTRPDGSTTDADTEAAAEAKNGLEYNAIASVMKTRNAIIRSALGIG